MSSIWGVGAAALNKGGEVLGTVGGVVQQKLDDTGVSSNVSYYVNSAAENTVAIGSKLYQTGS